MRAVLDIETALYEALTADQYSASAHVIPADLGHVLPHVHVVRTGGYTNNIAVDAHNIDFDVYADDQQSAMTEASNLCAWVRDLAGGALDVPCYSSEVITLPYGNPDPRHPTIGRATFKALIFTRVKGAEYA